jgi:hypothetical protein
MMRRLLVTVGMMVMGLTGSLGLSAATATHAAASTNVPAWGCGGWDCRGGHDRCDWCGGDRRDHRCDGWCGDRRDHRDRDRNRCDWSWEWGSDCRRGRW